MTENIKPFDTKIYIKQLKTKKITNYFFDNVSEMIRYNQKNNTLEVNAIINEANLIVGNQLHFIDKWDMERCQEIISFNEQWDWNFHYNDDPEWMFMLARMKWAVILLKAFLYTKDKKYVKKLKQTIYDFCVQEPYTLARENTTWRTIDVGLRLSNLINIFVILINQNEEDELFLKTLLTLIVEHYNFLSTRFEDWKILSNWGMIQLYPLFQFTIVFADLINNKNIQQEILHKVYRSVDIQVFADESHWEQSPMYHNEVLDVCSKIYWLAFLRKLHLDTEFILRLHKMHLYNLAILKPNRHQPMQGDSDDTSLTDRLQVGAALFDDGTLKYVTPQIVEECVVFDYGYNLLRRFENVTSAPSTQKINVLPYSDNYYYHSNQETNADYLWFCAVTAGSGHGHGNLLHLDLSINGKNFFIDSGRYTYKENNQKRTALKQMQQHNVPLVNNIQAQEFVGSWKSISYPQFNFGPYSDQTIFHFVEGSYDIAQLNKIKLSRQILTVENAFFLIHDFVSDSTAVKVFSQNFQLDKDVKVVNNESNVVTLKNDNVKIYVQQFGVVN